MGNSGNQSLIDNLINYLYHAEPIIRGASVWSLGQLLSRNDFKVLKKKLLKTEFNSYVIFELNIIN